MLHAVCLAFLVSMAPTKPKPHSKAPRPSQALLMARYRVQHAQAMLLKAETDTECEAAYAKLEAAKAALSRLEK